MMQYTKHVIDVHHAVPIVVNRAWSCAFDSEMRDYLKQIRDIDIAIIINIAHEAIMPHKHSYW